MNSTSNDATVKISPLPPYVWEEWKQWVINADRHLKGDCPLLEDEIIIQINEHINELSKALWELGIKT